jgi:CO/xanthine dehydrogenase Mo-binding subunit
MGQGNATALIQMAAYELNCQVDDLELILGDTLGPDAGSCDAARQMTFVGRACVAAAVDLRQKILEEAGKELNSGVDSLILVGKTVRNELSGESLPLVGLGDLKGVGQANIPEKEALMPGIPSHLYTTGVQIALVEVDLLTGQVDVLKMHSIIDAGKVINQQGIEGQTEGGIIQGLGYALYEDTIIKDGIFHTKGFSTYILPTSEDIPGELITTFLEKPSKLGPYGAKGIAEIVLVPTAPAILNAVADAVGIRITTIPLTAEEVLRNLSDKE